MKSPHSPKVPKGYRMLKVGEVRPENYLYIGGNNKWRRGAMAGTLIWENDTTCCAPILKSKRGEEMSNANHTPGPWFINQPRMGFSAIHGPKGEFVFGLAAGGEDEKQPDDVCDANARLIASAPMLQGKLDAAIARIAVLEREAKRGAGTGGPYHIVRLEDGKAITGKGKCSTCRQLYDGRSNWMGNLRGMTDNTEKYILDCMNAEHKKRELDGTDDRLSKPVCPFEKTTCARELITHEGCDYLYTTKREGAGEIK